MHSHKDVEVVTFVVQGEVKHIDPANVIHNGTLSAKGVQIITAGTGIVHNVITLTKGDGYGIWNAKTLI